jgi:hypothetical protein
VSVRGLRVTWQLRGKALLHGLQFSFVLCNAKETCGVCAFSLAWIFASGSLDELYQSLSLTHCFETILNEQDVVCFNT